MFQAPGVHVVAFVPVAGPVPPPMKVVTPDASASNACCGQMKWMCASMPPAVTMSPSPAIASVADAHDHPRRDARHHGRVARLADSDDATVFDADVGLVDARRVEDERVGDHADRARRRRSRLRLPLPIAEDLAAAELALVAVGSRSRARPRRRAPCRPGGRGRPSSGRTCRRSASVEGCSRRHRRPAATATRVTVLRLSWLEAHGRPGGDVEAHPGGRGAVEVERTVRLGEGVVAADLDGAIARGWSLRPNAACVRR